MEPTTLDSAPLTMDELSELISRHTQNASIAKVINEAMQRRLAHVSEGPAQHEQEDVSVSSARSMALPSNVGDGR